MNESNRELIVFTDFNLENPSSAGFRRILNYSKALEFDNLLIRIYSTRYCYKVGIIEKRISKNAYLVYSKKKIHYKTTFEDFIFVKSLKFYQRIYQEVESDTSNSKKTYLLYNSNLASVAMCLIHFKIIKRRNVFVEKNELKTAIILNMPSSSDSIFRKFALVLLKTFLIVPAIITDLLAVFFDGIIVISNRFLKLYYRFNKNIFKVPILVDPDNKVDQKKINSSKECQYFTIGYFGTISEKKDGLFSLVAAVTNLSKYNLILKIYGAGNEFHTKSLKNISTNNSTVKFYGQVESKFVPQKVAECDLLAFPRPKNLQTNFGFSTKLGEFLISKVPVLTTSVSDNEYYLKDNENAFILKAQKKNSINILTQKIISILETNPKKLKDIGTAGQKTALEYFNPNKYSSKLARFLFPD